MMLWVKGQQRKTDIVALIHHFHVEQGWPVITKLEHKIYDDGSKFSRDHSTFRGPVFKELSECVHINHIGHTREVI